MPSKKKLLQKLFQKGIPKDFSLREMDQLLRKCHCIGSTGGRGSSIKYFHSKTGRVLQFDKPHPGSNLYNYHIRMLRRFIEEIDENHEED